MAHPILNTKTNLNDMEIGDCIPCRYAAPSNAAGKFSELGTCVASEIPVAGAAVPDGLFYFIKVDKGLLIADRVVQTQLQWSALASALLTEGRETLLDPFPSMLAYQKVPNGIAFISPTEYMASTPASTWQGANLTITGDPYTIIATGEVIIEYDAYLTGFYNSAPNSVILVIPEVTPSSQPSRDGTYGYSESGAYYRGYYNSSQPTLNVWHHMKHVINFTNSTITTYVDGVVFNFGNSAFGAYAAGARCNLQIGVAPYSYAAANRYKNITILNSGATAPVPVILGSTAGVMVRSISGGNGYADYSYKHSISTLLHFDGATGSSTFTDSGVNPKLWTPVGGCSITDQYSKFGGSCGDFDGSGRNIITTPAHNGFNMGGNNFAVEFFIKRKQVSSGVEWIFGQSDAAASAASRAFNLCFTANKLEFRVHYGGTNSVAATSTSTLTDLTNFHHVAAVRNGANIYLFVDGVQWANASIGTNVLNNSTSNFSIGTNGDLATGGVSAYIDEFCITKYVAKYTATGFTPPTAPLTPEKDYFMYEVSSSIDMGMGVFPTNNEWDTYITKATLKNKITAGDNNIWHWNSLYSWTQETPLLAIGAATLRVARGSTAAAGVRYSLYSSIFTDCGFRPVVTYAEPDGSSGSTNPWY